MKRLIALVCCLALATALAGCGKKHVPTRPDYPTRTTRPAPTPAPEHKAGPSPKGTFRPYTIAGKRYHPLSTADGYVERGIASWYGRDFHGRKTSNGETYDMHAMTAAHKVLPMNTIIRVTREDTGAAVVLRVNDRGPFVGSRIVDLSYAGAKALDIVGPGTALVRLEAVGMAGETRTRSLAQAMENGRYYVQVGAFTFRENAVRLAEKLRAGAYPQSRLQKALVDGKTFWRVQAGVFDGMARAKRAHAELNRRYPSSFVIAD